MKKKLNIAVVGLGQVGIYLLNELNTKKKDIEIKTGKKINISAISAKNINKKRRFKINKKTYVRANTRIESNRINYKGTALGYTENFDLVQINPVNYSTNHNLLGGRFSFNHLLTNNSSAFSSIAWGYKAGGVNQHPYLSNGSRYFDPEYILNVLIQSGRSDSRMSKIISILSTQKINFSKIDKNKLDRLTKGELHQGIVAEVILPPLPGHEALIDFVTKLSNSPLILMLDSIQDPRNLGACLRSANAAGVDCVVINKDGSAPINGVVHKTSAGAINQLKIFQVTNLARVIKALKDKKLWVIGLDGNVTTSIYNINLIDPTVIVIGTEGKGLRQLIKKTCDQLAQIPMIGNVESLNVSVATGIVLFEGKRQRQSS